MIVARNGKGGAFATCPNKANHGKPKGDKTPEPAAPPKPDETGKKTGGFLDYFFS
jgi:hypothetical protein